MFHAPAQWPSAPCEVFSHRPDMAFSGPLSLDPMNRFSLDTNCTSETITTTCRQLLKTSPKTLRAIGLTHQHMRHTHTLTRSQTKTHAPTSFFDTWHCNTMYCVPYFRKWTLLFICLNVKYIFLVLVASWTRCASNPMERLWHWPLSHGAQVRATKGMLSQQLMHSRWTLLSTALFVGSFSWCFFACLLCENSCDKWDCSSVTIWAVTSRKYGSLNWPKFVPVWQIRMRKVGRCQSIYF